MNAATFPGVCAILDSQVGQTLTPAVAARIAKAFMELVLGDPLQLDLLAPVRAGSYLLQPERMAYVLPELAPLHEAHWHETEAYRHGLPFSPDYDWALQQEAAGQYLLLTARHDGALVGNYALVLQQSRHTQTGVATPHRLASEDTMFIVPEHRVGRLFLRLTQYGERAARTFGAQELRLSTKTTNAVGPMVERMGYEHVANQYVKFLRSSDVQ